MVDDTSRKKTSRIGRNLLISAAFIAWAAFSFLAGQFLVAGLYQLAEPSIPDLQSVNESVLMTVLTALSWTATLVIALWVPYFFLKQRVTREDIGLQRLPTWAELGLAAAGYIASSIAAALVIYIVSLVMPGFDADQTQDVGFSNLVFRYEYIVAFITLVIIAPFVEEIFFRGYLYSRLKKYLPTWVAIIMVSALFGIAHGQLNVAIMTFVMGIFLCLLRDLTGSLWPAITMHMIRNGVAFFFLFVAPTVL